jgi:hypothetical protein
LFGSALPQGTGAPGSAGARPAAGGPAVDFTLPTGNWQASTRPATPQRLAGPGDSTCLPGETMEGFSGLGPDFVADTGAGHGHTMARHPGSEAKPA